MSHIAICGDIHFGNNFSYSAFIDVQTKCFNEMTDICVDRGINTIYFLGDIFDNRSSILVPVINHVKNLFKSLTKKVQPNIIIGNHDTFYKNTNDVNSPSIIFDDDIFDGNSYNPINIFYSNPIEHTIYGKLCSLIPWINKMNEEETLNFIKKSTSRYCFGHFDISGFLMNSKIKCETGYDPKIFQKYDLVWSGHFHTRSQQSNIIYVGSMTQLNWNDYGQTRGFYIFDTETGNYEFIQLGEEIFIKFIIGENTKIDDFKNIKDKYVKVYINRKLKPKEYQQLMDILFKNIKYEIIDNTIIGDKIDFDIKEETIHEIIKGGVEIQENMTDKQKKDVYNLLMNAHLRVSKV